MTASYREHMCNLCLDLVRLGLALGNHAGKPPSDSLGKDAGAAAAMKNFIRV